MPAPELSPEALYKKGLDLGLDFITFTDHDSMKAYESLGAEREKLVSGVELTVRDPVRAGHTVHVNVYELDLAEFAELRELADVEHNLLSVIDFLKKHRLPYIYNHPLWFEFHEEADPAKVPELAKLFPVLEYNLHELKLKNEMIVALAERLGKGIAATTDAHTGKLGQIYTLAKGESFREFFGNIEKGKNFIVPEDLTREFLIEEMNTWIDLIFEKSRQSREKKAFLCGIRPIDAVVRISRSNLLHCSPALNRKTMELFYLLANSGIPASVYLHSEKSTARQIVKQIRH
ncbi:MAG: PHP domain-containing protein, partial [Methanosarcinaceae archaeon]|nr:PHP domain-containing protein [Methanosarcinaceae archaeon]